jgi:hypothetical protein
MTGSEYVRRNGAVSFGGLDEAVQNLQIIRHLRDPKTSLSKLVSSVHLLGVSMGGNGQFLTHLLQSTQDKPPWVNSTLLLCPLLNFRQTLEAHLKNTSSMVDLHAWARDKYQFLVDEDP